MQILENISLKPYNTFGIDITAKFYTEVQDIATLKTLMELPHTPYFLGSGSNILLTKPVNGLVVRNRLNGMAVVKEDAENVWIAVQSGEVWHGFVMYAINKGYGGIENLALIPGTVGATPIQNIGAYGVEVKDSIEQVTCYHWKEKTEISLSNNECKFGYRDSIFKNELRNKAFVTSVTYKLNKKPVLNTSYGAIEQELDKAGVKELTVSTVADAVIRIRRSKLPDPAVTGNAGSFFKNPVVAMGCYIVLKQKHPDMPSYPVNNDYVKVPAGWLIEQCKWKGYRKGDAGVHPKQALVLVNYGNATGAAIWDLSEEIIRSVNDHFGIMLEREVMQW